MSTQRNVLVPPGVPGARRCRRSEMAAWGYVMPQSSQEMRNTGLAKLCFFPDITPLPSWRGGEEGRRGPRAEKRLLHECDSHII